MSTESTIDQVVIEDQDGALVNLDSGEVLGYAGSPFVLPPLDPALTASMSREDVLARKSERAQGLKDAVLWATERRARAEARMEGITHEMNLLVAGVKERFETRIAEQKRKLAWIDTTYGDAMKEFAKEQLTGAKGKSVKLPWATLGFRASKGELEVSDAPTAAYTLIEHDATSAVKLTIDLGALHTAAAQDRDGPADALLHALMEAFEPKFTAEGVAANVQELDHVEVPVGVDIAILAGQVPDVLPEGVIGCRRNAPEDPLGKFYVKHK